MLAFVVAKRFASEAVNSSPSQDDCWTGTLAGDGPGLTAALLGVLLGGMGIVW
jgi:hypothetical protein